jgi:hypothetical protein
MNLLKPFNTEGFLIGLGIAAVGSLFAPAIKKGAKEIAVKGTQGAMMAGESASNMMQSGKESMNKIFPNMFKNKYDEKDQSFNENLINELKSDREQYSNAFQELVSTMKEIQSEVKSLRDAKAIEQ